MNSVCFTIGLYLFLSKPVNRNQQIGRGIGDELEVKDNITETDLDNIKDLLAFLRSEDLSDFLKPEDLSAFLKPEDLEKYKSLDRQSKTKISKALKSDAARFLFDILISYNKSNNLSGGLHKSELEILDLIIDNLDVDLKSPYNPYSSKKKDLIDNYLEKFYPLIPNQRELSKKYDLLNNRQKDMLINKLHSKILKIEPNKIKEDSKTSYTFESSHLLNSEMNEPTNFIYLSKDALELNQNIDKITSIRIENSVPIILRPYSFNELTELTKLELVETKIDELPVDVFSPLKNLKLLNLRNNEINDLPKNIFNGLENLKYLSISNNLLQQIKDNAFDGLKNLERLDLSYNKISSIKNKAFDGLEKLKLLRLTNNKIRNLPEDVFDKLKNLKRLYILEGNDISSKKIKNLDYEFIILKPHRDAKLQASEAKRRERIAKLQAEELARKKAINELKELFIEIINKAIKIRNQFINMNVNISSINYFIRDLEREFKNINTTRIINEKTSEEIQQLLEREKIKWNSKLKHFENSLENEKRRYQEAEIKRAQEEAERRRAEEERARERRRYNQERTYSEYREQKNRDQEEAERRQAQEERAREQAKKKSTPVDPWEKEQNDLTLEDCKKMFPVVDTSKTHSLTKKFIKPSQYVHYCLEYHPNKSGYHKKFQKLRHCFEKFKIPSSKKYV